MMNTSKFLLWMKRKERITCTIGWWVRAGRILVNLSLRPCVFFLSMFLLLPNRESVYYLTQGKLRALKNQSEWVCISLLRSPISPHFNNRPIGRKHFSTHTDRQTGIDTYSGNVLVSCIDILSFFSFIAAVVVLYSIRPVAVVCHRVVTARTRGGPPPNPCQYALWSSFVRPSSSSSRVMSLFLVDWSPSSRPIPCYFGDEPSPMLVIVC